jgi:hypothetical protein
MIRLSLNSKWFMSGTIYGYATGAVPRFGKRSVNRTITSRLIDIGAREGEFS